jgi:hypothetical protein
MRASTLHPLSSPSLIALSHRPLSSPSLIALSHRPLSSPSLIALIVPRYDHRPIIIPSNWALQFSQIDVDVHDQGGSLETH